MGRNKEIISKGNGGRPKGKKSLTGTSRLQHECAVDSCKFVARKGHVVEHQRKMVLWNDNGEAASEDNELYLNLSETRKLHTDFFRRNCYTLNSMPKNKLKISVGPMDRFFTANDGNNNSNNAKLVAPNIQDWMLMKT